LYSNWSYLVLELALNIQKVYPVKTKWTLSLLELRDGLVLVVGA